MHFGTTDRRKMSLTPVVENSVAKCIYLGQQFFFFTHQTHSDGRCGFPASSEETLTPICMPTLFSFSHRL